MRVDPRVSTSKAIFSQEQAAPPPTSGKNAGPSDTLGPARTTLALRPPGDKNKESRLRAAYALSFSEEGDALHGVGQQTDKAAPLSDEEMARFKKFMDLKNPQNIRELGRLQDVLSHQEISTLKKLTTWLEGDEQGRDKNEDEQTTVRTCLLREWVAVSDDRLWKRQRAVYVDGVAKAAQDANKSISANRKRTIGADISRYRNRVMMELTGDGSETAGDGTITMLPALVEDPAAALPQPPAIHEGLFVTDTDESIAASRVPQPEVLNQAAGLFEAQFQHLSECDMNQLQHPRTAFLLYELNQEHRFMAAMLDALARAMRANNIRLSPENVDCYLPGVVRACVEKAKLTLLDKEYIEMHHGMSLLFADPDAFQPKTQKTWAILDGIRERLGITRSDVWRLIIDRKKIDLLKERGIEDTWLLMLLFDAEEDFSYNLARGWEHMLRDVDSSEPFSIDMARRWHATVMGHDDFRLSDFADDTSCPIVEHISWSSEGDRALRERLRILKTTYNIPSEVYADEETEEKTSAMGVKFAYVNRVDTDISRLERFSERFTRHYLSVSERIAKSNRNPERKSDLLLLEDINYIQYLENAHLFPDGNGRVWATLFPNFCLLKRKELPVVPHEPYVIDAFAPHEILSAYRRGQEEFRKWTTATAPEGAVQGVVQTRVTL